MACVAKACRCASLPGETCRAGVSTSTKSRSANQARMAAVIRLRANRNGRRSACCCGVHHGEGICWDKRRDRLGGGEISANRYRGATRNSSAESRQLRARPSPSRNIRLKVAASSLRKGAVVDMEGKLYVVLDRKSVHPGKGTPVTQLEMRRINDGVKVNERYKTTDTLEKAFIDERTHTYLYHDGDHYIFMDPETFDQVSVSESILGDAAPFLDRKSTRLNS